MSDQPPQAFIFMRVGKHAGEDFDSILERKRQELRDAGMIFWGYGGTTLHPIKRVQPFARMCLDLNGHVQILMQPIDSKADPDILPATEFSVDGINWDPIPEGIEVTGSRYALVLDEIKPGDLNLDLRDFAVGCGPSQGKNAAQYLRGRVDKGCLVTTGASNKEPDPGKALVPIRFQAQLREPYAVMLRH